MRRVTIARPDRRSPGTRGVVAGSEQTVPQLVCTFLFLCLNAVLATEPKPPDGNAVIRDKAGGSEIVITTTNRVGGAIHSLTWNGKEFLDSFDHGRQLQSALNGDCCQKMLAETFNPTEAGSRNDNAGDKSSSKLLSLRAEGAELGTKTQMAFWLAPGEKSAANSPAMTRCCRTTF